ncbi:MAG: LacI family DNA-binding transcriptional regulator [Candidatus Methylacidiphilales bacterium]|nr:LacI family DNA-binding transcriptional regulator [Candidatus Methylacidiphilales bacterium]
MKTIAEAAGVSVMTVSRALRNQPVLSQTTRTRIQAIAKEIGYRPNPMVSTLMAQLHGSRTNAESPIICYATAYPNPDHWRDLPYNVDAYNGAARRAEALGYRLEHFCFTEPGMTFKRACRVLRARGVVGLLMAPLPIPPPTVLDLNWDWFACATVGYSLEEANLHHAMVDHVAVMRLVYRSLYNLGYRRIGLAIRPVDDTEVDNKWISGFCTEQFFRPAAERVPILLEPDWCEANFMRWYLPHRPEAVITVHTEVIDWLKSAGFKIPRDVGVAMPDLSFRSQFPDLSGVDQRTELVGEIALDLVVEQIHHNQRGIPPVAKIVMVEGTWVQGKNVRSFTPARKRTTGVPAHAAISASK